MPAEVGACTIAEETSTGGLAERRRGHVGQRPARVLRAGPGDEGRAALPQQRLRRRASRPERPGGGGRGVRGDRGGDAAGTT